MADHPLLWPFPKLQPSPNPSAPLWFWGMRTQNPLFGSDRRGPTRCCSPSVQLGTISRRRKLEALTGSTPPTSGLFVSVSDPRPALHIPYFWGGGDKDALSLSTPSLMNPKFQTPVGPILHTPLQLARCSLSIPLHIPGPGSPVPCFNMGMRSMLPQPWARLPVGGPVCRSLVQLRVLPACRAPVASAPLRPPRPTPALSPESLGPRAHRRHRHEAPSEAPAPPQRRWVWAWAWY